MLTRVPYRHGFMMSGYDTAQICEQGHVINMYAQTRPQKNQDHCTACGAKTIKTCPHCQESIHGYYHVPKVVGPPPKAAPSFCHRCGKAYPWTESKMAAAVALIKESEGLSDSEKEALTKSLRSGA